MRLGGEDTEGMRNALSISGENDCLLRGARERSRVYAYVSHVRWAGGGPRWALGDAAKSDVWCRLDLGGLWLEARGWGFGGVIKGRDGTERVKRTCP